MVTGLQMETFRNIKLENRLNIWWKRASEKKKKGSRTEKVKTGVKGCNHCGLRSTTSNTDVLSNNSGKTCCSVLGVGKQMPGFKRAYSTKRKTQNTVSSNEFETQRFHSQYNLKGGGGQSAL